MTTEERPYLGLDNTYEKQRKCRMQDAIDDYLQDERVDARQAYEEMLSCIDDVITHHKNNMERAVKLKSLMKGHRDLDFMDDVLNDPSLAKKWQYDKILLTED